MSTRDPTTPSDDPPPAAARALPAGLAIRAREPGDWQAMAALRALPRVRWGTLATPFETAESTRKFLESPPPEGSIGIVAVLDGHIVGTASITRGKGRRSHVGLIGMCVHDDFHRRGIGSRLMAALVDAADNWLDLRRLELTVFIDNAPAIALYEKFGFVVEGTRRAASFRDGALVDDFMMARLRAI
jgi:putative acetyltransferase